MEMVRQDLMEIVLSLVPMVMPYESIPLLHQAPDLSHHKPPTRPSLVYRLVVKLWEKVGIFEIPECLEVRPADELVDNVENEEHERLGPPC